MLIELRRDVIAAAALFGVVMIGAAAWELFTR